MIPTSASSRIEFFAARTSEAEMPSAETDFVESNLNLLAHAQSIELEIGSRCGGHGVCGGDRVRILAPSPKLSAVTDAERRHLSKDEIARGYRLACQCFPESSDFSLRVAIFPA